jgi:hypothetical protein
MFLGVGVVLVAATVASLAFVHEPLAVEPPSWRSASPSRIAQAPQQALIADLVPPARRAAHPDSRASLIFSARRSGLRSSERCSPAAT